MLGAKLKSGKQRGVSLAGQYGAKIEVSDSDKRSSLSQVS